MIASNVLRQIDRFIFEIEEKFPYQEHIEGIKTHTEALLYLNMLKQTYELKKVKDGLSAKKA